MELPVMTGGDQVGSLKLPQGTRVEAAEDRQSARFFLPSGYVFMYTDPSGTLVELEQVVYTCDCSGAGGCNVFKFGTDYGCLQGSCLGACTGAFRDPGDPDPEARIAGEVAIADLKGGISFLTADASDADLLKPSPLLLQNPVIQEKLARFQAERQAADAYARYQGLYEEGAYLWAMVDFFGTKLAYRTPSYLEVTNGNPLREVRCRCNSGQPGCTLVDFGGGGGFYICDGGECTSVL